MNIFKFVSFTFITSILCTSVLAGNSIYKWKDKDGVVHYSQNAPQGQEVQVITTKTPRTPIPDEAPAATQDNSVIAPDASSPDATGNETAVEKVPVATKDQATCDKALKAIVELQQPIITLNGKVMTLEEKNVQIRSMNEIKKIHCP